MLFRDRYLDFFTHEYLLFGGLSLWLKVKLKQGIAVRLKNPDASTKSEILKLHVGMKEIIFPKDVIELLAINNKFQIRELISFPISLSRFQSYMDRKFVFHW